MSAIYKILFEVTIGHEYYDNGVCKDLTIFPLPETAKLLLGHKLVYRKGVNGFKILFGTDDSGETPFIELDQGIKLTFSMHLNNPTFLNFTDLPHKSSNKDIYHFENLRRGEKVERELFDEYEMETDVESIPQSKLAKFNFEFTSESPEVTLQVTNPIGNLIIDKLLQSDNQLFSEALDFRNSLFGIYTFSRIVNRVVEKRDNIFFADPIKIKRPFGLITIQKDDSISFDKPTSFNIGFVTQSTPWRYNIKLTKDYSGKDFSINDDEKFNTNNNGSRYTEAIKFIKTREVDGYEKDSILTFESGEMVEGEFQPQNVPYYESPKKHLQLKINPGNKTVISHLPNPAINNLKSEVYINV